MTEPNDMRRGGSFTLPEGATDDEIDAASRGPEPEQTPAPAPAQE